MFSIVRKRSTLLQRWRTCHGLTICFSWKINKITIFFFRQVIALCFSRDRWQQMKTLKNIGIPGPEPSLYNGNMTELHSKVTAAVLFQLFENFTCMCILFLRCEQDFFSFLFARVYLILWMTIQRSMDMCGVTWRDFVPRLLFLMWKWWKKYTLKNLGNFTLERYQGF